MAEVKLFKLSVTGQQLEEKLAKIEQNLAAINANSAADEEFKSLVAATYATKAELAHLLNNDEEGIDSIIEVVNLLESKANAGEVADMAALINSKANASDLANYQPKGNYLTEHQSLDGYATENYVDEKISALLNGVDTDHDTLKEIVDLLNNKQDAAEFISSLESKADKSDLDKYALKSELPEVPSIEGLISEEDADDKYQPKGEYLVESDLDNYALKSEIPTVPTKVSAFENDANYLTEHQDLSDYALKSEIPTVPTKVSEFENDANYLTEHQDLSDYALKTDLNDYQPAGEYITSEEIAYKANVADVYTKIEADAKFQTAGEYVTESSLNTLLNGYQPAGQYSTEEYVNTKITEAIDNVVGGASAAFDTLGEIASYIAGHEGTGSIVEILGTKANKSELENYQPKGDYLTEHQDLSSYALKSELEPLAVKSAVDTAIDSAVANLTVVINDKLDASYLPELASKTDLEDYQPKGDYLTEHQDLSSYALKSELPDVSGFITEHQDLSAYALKSELPTIPTKVSVFENDAEYLTEHQSLVGYATEQYVDDKISYLLDGVDENFDTLKELADALTDEDTGLAKINTVLGYKANEEDVYDKAAADDKFVDKAKYDELNNKYTTLFNVVYSNATGETATALNADYVANNLSNENTSVEITEGELGDVTIPETTKAMSVTAPMQDNSTVTLSSPKAFTLINTSDEPVNVTIDAPVGTSIPTMSLSGDFEDLTVNNGTISAKSGADPLTATNVTVDNEIGKNVSISGIVFNDNATITTTTVPSLGVANNNTDQDAPNATINAENSTVTLNKGQWNSLSSNVSDETLIVTNNAHINTLNIVKGNVVVYDREIANRIDNVVNNTEYTLSLKTSDVTTGAELNSAMTGNPGIVNMKNDISRGRIGWGIFGAGNYLLDLQGHTLTISDATFGIKARNLVNLKIVDTVGGGKFINNQSYGLWAGENTVITVDVPESTEIVGTTHTLYCEGSGKPTINVVNGTYKLLVSSEETDVYDANGNYKFMLNHLDATYTREGNCFNITGGTFYGFDPARMNGDPGAEYSMIDLNEYETQIVDTFVDSRGTTMNVYKVVKK